MKKVYSLALNTSYLLQHHFQRQNLVIMFYKNNVLFLIFSFKENSPWCAQAGLLLASGNQHSPGVKHFGLQLMEHTVKYRWTQITQAEKIFIKVTFMISNTIKKSCWNSYCITRKSTSTGPICLLCHWIYNNISKQIKLKFC